MSASLLQVWTDKDLSVAPDQFDDWYSFADYVKQENEAGRSVSIYRWMYFHEVTDEDIESD